jgi:hypothetical protein
MKKIVCLLTVTMLAACGTIDNAVRSDESIQEKAAFALGTTPEKVVISNRRSEIDSVKFNATVNGRVFQCYYTTAGISSDALCSPTDGKPAPASSNCNALLKAAGKC